MTAKASVTAGCGISTTVLVSPTYMGMTVILLHILPQCTLNVCMSVCTSICVCINE